MKRQLLALALAVLSGSAFAEYSFNVSNNTASYHVKQLFFRLDAHDRADAVSRILGVG